MPEHEALPAKPMEQAVRALLRKHVRQLDKVLLSPELHQTLEDMVRQCYLILLLLRREARRKERSKAYEQIMESLLAELAEGELGRLADLTPEQVATFEGVLDGITSSLVGKAPQESLDSRMFVKLQEKLFVAPKKRGPKNQAIGDEAFLRHLQGEEITRIARSLDPAGYERDPVNAIQKISRAIQRRRQQAGAGH